MGVVSVLNLALYHRQCLTVWINSYMLSKDFNSVIHLAKDCHYVIQLAKESHSVIQLART